MEFLAGIASAAIRVVGMAGKHVRMVSNDSIHRGLEESKEFHRYEVDGVNLADHGGIGDRERIHYPPDVSRLREVGIEPVHIDVCPISPVDERTLESVD